jgi:tryptophan synthase alpha chain
VTGAANLDTESLAPAVERVRKASGVPVAVGFGIRTPEHAAAAASSADAVVIGSALVERLGRTENPGDAVRVAVDYLAPIRAAMDNTAPAHKDAVTA